LIIVSPFKLANAEAPQEKLTISDAAFRLAAVLGNALRYEEVSCRQQMNPC